MTSTTGNPEGFTLVEVLLTVVVLGIGSIMIQQTLLRSAGLVSKSGDSLRVQVRIGEKIWDAREKIVYADAPSVEGGSGEFAQSRRRYAWSVGVQSTTVGADTFVIRASGRRAENPEAGETARETYAVSRPPSP